MFTLTWEHTVNYRPASNVLIYSSLLGVLYEVKKEGLMWVPLISVRLSVFDVVSKTNTMVEY